MTWIFGFCGLATAVLGMDLASSHSLARIAWHGDLHSCSRGRPGVPHVETGDLRLRAQLLEDVHNTSSIQTGRRRA